MRNDEAARQGRPDTSTITALNVATAQAGGRPDSRPR